MTSIYKKQKLFKKKVNTLQRKLTRFEREMLW